MARKESIQKELNRKLLKYVFRNRDLPNKRDLKKIICKDNLKFQKSFSKSYEILEVGNILENGKLAPKLKWRGSAAQGAWMGDNGRRSRCA